MGKALVIKNVDFNTNALTRVTLINDIPCTAISLDESSVSLTSLIPTTLTATLTPSDTTDEVSWTTSDSNVATVADGVVTPLKAGSVTITATCGDHSATCSFTIRVFLDIDFEQHYYFCKKTDSGGDGIQMDGSSSATAYGFSYVSTDQTGTNKKAYKQSSLDFSGDAYPIKMLPGMTGLAFTVPNQAIKISPCWGDTNGTTGLGSNIVPLIYAEGSTPWSSAIPSGSRSVNAPGSTEDCFFISVYLPSASGTITQEMLNAITVEVLYETVS